MSDDRPQTSGEEIGNSISHVIGSHFGAAMLALLVWQSVNSGESVVWKVTSGSIFGASVILLYAVSSAYHAVSYEPAKRILQKLDHMAIYFLIAGSYTPPGPSSASNGPRRRPECSSRSGPLAGSRWCRRWCMS